MKSAPLNPLLLLCLDLQSVFLSAIADGATVQRRCAFALEAATGLGVNVAFTEQVPARLGATAPELRALAPSAPVFAKNTFSALADASFRQALTDRGIEHLLLCGLETPVCVYQTALDALAADLQVTLLSDAIGARRPGDGRVCEEALVRSGAHLLPAETIFYSLLHDTAHPFFKAYTQLVKRHA